MLSALGLSGTGTCVIGQDLRERSGVGEQGSVAAGSCCNLNSCAQRRVDDLAGKRDGGQACEAEGRGVAEDGLAGGALICTRAQPVDRGAGKHQEIEVTQQIRDAGPKLCETLSKWSEIGGGQRVSPAESLRDCGFELVIEAAVQGRGLVRLNSGEDLYRVQPACCVELREGSPCERELLEPSVVGDEHVFLAIRQEGQCHAADTGRRRRAGERDAEESVCDWPSVARVAKEKAERVEGGREMRRAIPGLRPPAFRGGQAVGGTIPHQAAEGGRHADGSTGVRADGCESGALLHAGSSAAGGAASEQRRIARLEAVAIIRVLAGDAVGERMEVGFADDEGAGCTQVASHRRVLCGG